MTALLYAAAAGMLVEAGFLFVQTARPEEPLEARLQRGVTAAREGLQRGHAAVRSAGRWPYHLKEWWRQFAAFRCTGRIETPEAATALDDVTTAPEPLRLADQVELLSVLFDRDPAGHSHVLLRYCTDEGVEIAVHRLRPGDHLREPLRVWRLARIAEDAESVWFVRGDTGAEVELFKAWLQVSPDIIAEIHRLRDALGARQLDAEERVTAIEWLDGPETRIVDGEVHVSHTDVRSLREDETLLRRFHLEPYRGRSGNVRGVRLRAVDSELGRRYGVRTGDVLLMLNGVAVTTPASVHAEGKRQYERGVRVFRLEILSGGQLVERVLRLPPD